jgi:cbb3-type cytochrome oxidase subunit 3
LAEFITSGRAVGVIALIMLVEAVVLYLYRAKTGRGIALSEFAANFAAGLCLLAAVRFALVGADWTLIAGSLALAGAAHVADLKSRWRP